MTVFKQFILTEDSNPNATGISPVLINTNYDIDLNVIGSWEHHHQAIFIMTGGLYYTWFLTEAVVL
jgi:hypothetical protein